MRRVSLLGVAVAITLTGCESVVGLTEYKALPESCNPTNPTGGAPEFLNCTSGQKCVWSTSKFVCQTGVGSSGRGAACTASSACAAGLNCLFGRCYAYCDTAQPKCNDNELCRDTGTNVGAHAYGGCTPANCNPFSATDDTPPYTPCAPNVACHFVDSSFVQCNAGGSAVEGGSCNRSADCGPGLFCIFFSNAGQCRYPCRTTLGNADCATKTKKVCKPTRDGFVIDGVDYGYCDVP